MGIWLKCYVFVIEVFENPALLQTYDQNFEMILPENLIEYLTSNTSLQLAERVKDLYFGKKKLTQETLIQYVNVSTDHIPHMNKYTYKL